LPFESFGPLRLGFFLRIDHENKKPTASFLLAVGYECRN
jgi:hypothetical protein